MEFTLLKNVLFHCLAVLALTPEQPGTNCCCNKKVTAETAFMGDLYTRYRLGERKNSQQQGELAGKVYG